MVFYSCSEVRLASARFPPKNLKSFFLETSMSTNRDVDRCAVTPQKDRASLCSFTFTDGRRCRTPRRDSHPHLCAFHARKEAQALAGEKAGEDIAFFLSGDYVSAGDVSFALGRLFAAVAQGHVKPKTASTLGFLGQTLVQTLHLAQNEYISAYGTASWKETVRNNFDQCGNRQCPPDPPAPQPRPAQIANQPDADEPSISKTESNSAPN
jgi:hypothetical protein